MAITEEGCAEVMKAGNLSASFLGALHDCKEVFWPYKSGSKTKSFAINLIVISCCFFRNGSGECCDHSDYKPVCQKTQSITSSPKILKETVNLFGLGHFHLDLPNFHWSLFLLMYFFQGLTAGGLDGYIVKMPSIYNKLLTAEILLGLFCLKIFSSCATD